MTVSQNPQAVRRPVILAAIMLVAVAVLLVALRAWLDRPVVDEVVVVVPAIEPEQAAPIPEPDIDQTESAPPAVTEIGVPPQFVAPPERFKVVLLPARAESGDPAAEALVSAVRHATLRGLLGMANVDVIDVSAAELAAVAPPNAGSLREGNLLYLAVSRRYESALVAEIAEQSLGQSSSWLIGLQVVRPGGMGGGSRTFSKNGAYRPGGDPESVGMEYAQRIARDVGRDSNPNIDTAAARNILLDATRSEQERWQAFTRLGGEALDSETLAVAVDLATRAASAETRQRVWSQLRRTAYDPVLAQPLGYALLYDQDATVRTEAAVALAAYLDTPGSRTTLENAARNDSSSDVRLAARMAMMDYDEQLALKRETLFDRSLTPAERLAPTTIFGMQSTTSIFQPSAAEQREEALAYAEILSATDDPDLKLQALSSMQRGSLILSGGVRNVPPEITRVLIESAEVADDRVRRSALNALRLQRENPEVRAVLQAVLEREPELAAELRIAEALAPSRTPLFSLPEPAALPPVRGAGSQVPQPTR